MNASLYYPKSADEVNSTYGFVVDRIAEVKNNQEELAEFRRCMSVAERCEELGVVYVFISSTNNFKMNLQRVLSWFGLAEKVSGAQWVEYTVQYGLTAFSNARVVGSIEEAKKLTWELK